MSETEARKKWTKANTTYLSAKLNNNTDRDILDYLNGKQTQTEIKKALRYYMAHLEEIEKEE